MDYDNFLHLLQCPTTTDQWQQKSILVLDRRKDTLNRSEVLESVPLGTSDQLERLHMQCDAQKKTCYKNFRYERKRNLFKNVTELRHYIVLSIPWKFLEINLFPHIREIKLMYRVTQENYAFKINGKIETFNTFAWNSCKVCRTYIYLCTKKNHLSWFVKKKDVSHFEH
jgi:hypothetical protein